MTQNVKAATSDFGLLAYFPSALLSYITTLVRLLSFFQGSSVLGLFISRGMEVGLGLVVYPASEGSRGRSCSLRVRPADRPASLWGSLSRLDKVGRDTRNFFSP